MSEQQAVNVAMNATSMAELKEQMKAVQTAMAEQTATEVQTILSRCISEGHDERFEELPTPSNSYLLGRMAAALFMALRDELVSNYMRVESSQKDKVILAERMATGAFRSDVERASAERSLSFYESQEARLQEVEYLIKQVVSVHKVAQEWQTMEDNQRQSDIPVDERTYVTLPALRWATTAEKQEEGWEVANDHRRLTDQAKFWLQYNANR